MPLPGDEALSEDVPREDDLVRPVAIVVRVNAHAVLCAVCFQYLEPHALVEADRAPVDRGSDGPHGAAPAPTSLVEEHPVESPSQASRPAIWPDPDEVDVGIVGWAANDADEEGDDLPVLLDGEARPGKVPEEEARQLVRDPASAPPPVDDRDHGGVFDSLSCLIFTIPQSTGWWRPRRVGKIRGPRSHLPGQRRDLGGAQRFAAGGAEGDAADKAGAHEPRGVGGKGVEKKPARAAAAGRAVLDPEHGTF
ncbi:MAG: hypothetical protein AVDCRST_MAG12-1162 [uncultured Rubrobacteraceae bacterium]|uniref:Uncharacterized protein n=1 Tax=uncultured Rubrobacteraceae bacterium TaxID=349277 RepID=A0A6J4RK90_9ACTN|nr:MAG: hypothetical protein AVDCRST_MAG12-1162 [uncultured Rubrobacteraceae bacterium]